MVWLIRWFRAEASIDFALRVDGGGGREASLVEISGTDIWGAEISGVQISGANIWGTLPSLPCRHLLPGPSILWQRKQKIIVSVKLGMGK